jgi:hypothetical protein
MKAAEPTTDAFLFRKGRHGCFFIIIQPPSHAKTGCAIMVSITRRAPRFPPRANTRVEQLNVEGRPFSRSRTDTQTVVIKSMNYFNRSTKIIKSMIIKKKTTTLYHYYAVIIYL